jgi:hypothetical protein
MKRVAAKNTAEILRKVESIEKEIKDLKLTLLKSITPSNKKPITLKGVLKGVEVTEEDISSAKKSLYSKIGM